MSEKKNETAIDLFEKTVIEQMDKIQCELTIISEILKIRINKLK